MLTALQIVTIVRTLITAMQSDQQIADTLNAMGVFASTDSPSHAEPLATAQPVVKTFTARVGIAPSVKYKLVPGMTLARLQAKLPDGTRVRQIAELIASSPDGITKREVLAAIREYEPNAGPGVAMSAIHGLQQREIVRSVPLDPVAASPKAKLTAQIRKPLAKR